MHRSPLILAAVLLNGCGAFSSARPLPPAELMVRCPTELPTAQDGMSSTLLSLLVDWAETYHACAARHGKLVEAIDAEQRD